MGNIKVPNECLKCQHFNPSYQVDHFQGTESRCRNQSKLGINYESLTYENVMAFYKSKGCMPNRTENFVQSSHAVFQNVNCLIFCQIFE